MVAKIFVGGYSTPVFFDIIPTFVDHSFLFYDADGDLDTTGDQEVIEGAPAGAPLTNLTAYVTTQADLQEGGFPTDFDEDNDHVRDRDASALHLKDVTAVFSGVSITWSDLKTYAGQLGAEDPPMSSAFDTGLNYGITSTNCNTITNTLLMYAGSSLLQDHSTDVTTRYGMLGGQEIVDNASHNDTFTLAVDSGRYVLHDRSGDADTINLSLGSSLVVHNMGATQGDLQINIDGIDPADFVMQRSFLDLKVIQLNGAFPRVVVEFKGYYRDVNTNGTADGAEAGGSIFIDDGASHTQTIDLDDPASFTRGSIVDTLHDVVESIATLFGGAKTELSPLVLDLDGDGIELAGLMGSDAVYFDLNGDGYAEASGWVGTDDGLLAIDVNADGVINDGSELFGDQTGYANGFLALAQLDSNTDDVIDSSDAQWGDLRVWIDANGDGYTDAGELFTLGDLDITEIELTYSNVNYALEGNTVKQESTFTIDGNTREVVDAYFATDVVNSLYAQEYALDSRVLSLADLRGRGTLPDLAIAMSLDNDASDPDSLLSLVTEVLSLPPGELFALDSNVADAVRAIMFRWAGVDGVDPESRGGHIDGRELGFLERMLGEDYLQRNLYPNPGAQAAEPLNEAFLLAFDHVFALLTAQAAGGELFTGDFFYSMATDAVEGITGLDSGVLDGLETEATGLASTPERLAFWSNVVRTIEYTIGTSNLSGGDQTALGNAIVGSDITLDLTDVLNNLDHIEPEGGAYYGTSGADNLGGSPWDDSFYGGAGNDTLSGGDGDDALNGEADADTLTGGGGDDWLDGGTGADTMVGGAGSDVYEVDNASDVVSEASNEGDDLVVTTISYTLGANLESLWVDGSGAVDITGNSLDNTLRGESGVNILSGGGGNDILDGNTGADTMSGGTGDDTYVVDNAGDVVSESSSEGTDTVQSSITYSLGAHLENLILIGAASLLTATGNALDNTLVGNDAINVLSASDGNDYLNGGAAADTMIGGAGDDTYILSAASDVVSEATGEGTDHVFVGSTYTLTANVENVTVTGTYSTITVTGNGLDNVMTGNATSNTLFGGDGNDVLDGGDHVDRLYGDAGTDTIIGGAGDDSLNGGAGADTMMGGSGDDTFVVDDASDMVSEASSEGTDLVQASVSYTLSANVENLTLTGGSAINGVGNSLVNTLFGNSADNILDGGAGADSMHGSLGNDTFIVDDVGDLASGSNGTDLILASVSFSLASGNENITLIGASHIDATGNTAVNTLTGNAGNNILDGASGADTMAGGAGDDTYVVDNASDVVTENSSEGTDIVLSGVNRTLGSHVEHLTLTGTATSGTGNALDNTLTGNSSTNVLSGADGNDVLDGQAGADSLVGGLGDDTYIVDNVSEHLTENASEGADSVQSSASWTLGSNFENLTLTGSANISAIGNSAANIINGNSGNNVLDGGAGADTLAAGAGDDTYNVDDAGDIVSEGGSAGTDIVQASVTWSLGSNVENLTLTGASGLSGTGNSADNIITGNTGVNVLTGAGGNDVLDGGSGADTLIGGTGDDTYVIDNTGDVISENASAGTDLVQSSVSWSLSADIENLTLTGSSSIGATGSAVVNILTGNSGNNSLDGGSGADTMIGGAGNDTYAVDNAGDVLSEGASAGADLVQSTVSWSLAANVENLTLTGVSNTSGAGNSAANVITGNSGDNVLAGAAGDDTAAGGSGSDTYVFSDGDGVDVITDTIGSADAIVFGASVASGSAVYTRNGSDLVIEYGTGSDSITVAGFFIGNEIEEVRFDDTTVHDFAYMVAQTQIATSGDDMLYGSASGDVLNGLGGNDVLDGAGGADTLIGGTGDDTFVVDDVGDGLSENASEGTDLVQASVTWTLGTHFENLTLTGVADVSGTGNTANNTITGNDGNNVLMGGAGDDVLNGGNGNDTASYASASGGVVVNLGTGVATGDGTDTLTSIQNATGSANVDTLTGSAAANVLDGGAGADTMIGAAGDDTYVVDDVSDVVSENSSEGTDLVLSSLTYSLGSNVENLRLTGISAINGTGNTAANVLTGNSAVNALTGGAGNDILDGGAGADTLIGGTNDDTYVVDNAGDVLSENASEGGDIVQASISWTLAANFENLTLTGSGDIIGVGNTNANTIVGNAGNNLIDGGTNHDDLIGGLGDDTYIVDNAFDTITENTNEGTDLVQTNLASYTLATNVENLVLTGSSNITGVGNSAANVVTGNSGNNVLNGAAAADTLIGGAGNDSYTVDDSGDVVSENASEGTDRVTSSITWTLGANVENLVLSGASTINGTGNSLNNSLLGNTGVNILSGGDGNDSIDGSTGGDTMLGGLGDDTFTVDDSGDIVSENASEGTDLVLSSVTFTLGANVENLQLTVGATINGTGNSLDNSITGGSVVNILDGGAGNDRLDGNNGADTMIGGTGDDTFVIDNVGDVVSENASEGTDLVQSSIAYTLGANLENLTLTASVAGTGNSLDNVITGASGTNVLTGNGGNDVLDGGASADTLIGGTGDDTYVVDSASESITENASEGTDLVLSSVTHTLAANVENLTLTATAVIGTGNALDNVLTGNGSVNTLTGGSGVDILSGLGSNDTLDGGIGADTMIGGVGDDTFVVDDSGDVVSENASEGTELVQSSLANYTLTSNVENLTLTGSSNINGTGNSLANILTGNSGNNILDGGAGADSMVGGSGNDTFVVDDTSDVVTDSSGTELVLSSATSFTLVSSMENLTLTGSSNINGTGNSSVNILTGNSGNNSLSGGTGADTMIGGTGDDTYVIDNVSDVVSENASEGTDLVQSSINWTIGADFENLTLTSTATSGTGNGLNNILTGNASTNILSGGTGNDVLDGAAGADSLIGGTGDDTYVVDNASEHLTENASEGTDLVQSSLAWTLAANFENLTLTGSSAINGTGNGDNNAITGNAGANTLSGGGGNDILAGGDGLDSMSGSAGADTFVFHVATAYNNIDVVTDFNTGQSDVLNISDLLTGWTGSVTDWVRISDSGGNSTVEVDRDGTGGGYSWSQIATLSGVTGLTDEATLVTNGNLVVS